VEVRAGVNHPLPQEIPHCLTPDDAVAAQARRATALSAGRAPASSLAAELRGDRAARPRLCRSAHIRSATQVAVPV